MNLIDPKNLSAQLHYRAAGNPPSALPASAISNAFPGLEFDFRNIWRRLFKGVELHEADNYVVNTADGFDHLKGRRLLRVADQPIIVKLIGPQSPGGQSGPLTSAGNPDGVAMLEWSNSLAEVLQKHVGKKVACEFTRDEAPLPVGRTDRTPVRIEQLEVRPLFARSEVMQAPLPVIDSDMVQAGELTRGLCSPWQNDYRECACYYWAASRPDYVNVETDGNGTSVGNSWLAVDREPREYVLDDREDSRLVSYQNLFQDWQGQLRFVVGGRDHDEDGQQP